MQHIIDLAFGAGAVVAAYVLYLAITKGGTYAFGVVKGWWTKGASQMATLKGDLASAHSKIAALEADVATIKGKVGA